MSDDDVRRRHLELVRRSFDAVSRGDVDTQLESCTDDVVLELPYADPPVRLQGKEAIRAHVGPALQIFSFELQISNVFECRDPDTLILEYTSEGRCTTTGQPYANSYIGVIQFRDGRICAQREYYNPVMAAVALQPQAAST
jgi:uncharacterized protein